VFVWRSFNLFAAFSFSKQITLNETHDALRDVQQHLSDLVVGHEILAEELEEERKEAATEKQQLKEEVVRYISLILHTNVACFLKVFLIVLF